MVQRIGIDAPIIYPNEDNEPVFLNQTVTFDKIRYWHFAFAIKI